VTQKQAELDDLVAHIGEPPRVILEIGVDQGHSFHHWEETWPTATLIGVDIGGGPWSSGGRPLSDSRVICADSHDPATLRQVKDRLAGQKVDFLFIDGDHSFDGVAQDYWTYRSLVHRGGTIALHDICPHEPQTGVYVHDFWQRLKPGQPDAVEIIHPPTTWGGIGVITR
jgi:cephalosporin hydroxylase